ncbi:hypothetical protein CJF30_00009239 [Rutstroemia sp. NJR-2017a BBW]|nr:hypothetical protein CJF30_00009239 [Rutstroemia sp. NJR-2017a BBW]
MTDRIQRTSIQGRCSMKLHWYGPLRTEKKQQCAYFWKVEPIVKQRCMDMIKRSFIMTLIRIW